MTKSFNTDIPSDNAMNQVYFLKQFYIDLRLRLSFYEYFTIVFINLDELC